MVDRRLWFKHQCAVCKMLFVSERDVVLHEATHEKPDFACSTCNELFETDVEYNVHRSIGCELNGRAQVCKVCGAVFEQVRELYNHHRLAHLDDQKFQCKVCSATFSWPENLEKHEVLHQTNSSMCKTCGAMFASMASLKVHLWKAHSVNVRDQDSHIIEMPVACRSNCKDCKSIGTAANLCQGCQTSAPDDASSRPDDKPFKCPHCNWAFKYDFSYTLHMKMHEDKLSMKRTSWDTTAHQTNGENIHLKCSSPPDDCSLHNKEHRIPDDASAKRKKTVYIRKADFSCNFPSFKPKVILASKSQELTSSELVFPAKEDSLMTGDASIECVRQSPSVTSNKLPKSEPTSNGAFTCKSCMVTFQYDFSYVAHMKYHEKVKEMGSESNSKYQQELELHQERARQNKLSATEILLNSDGAIINPDGSILIKVGDIIQKNLMDSFAAKACNYPARRPRASSLASDVDNSSTKYVLIQSSKSVLDREPSNTSDNNCVVEEVINIDGQNSSLLEVAYLPEELKGCLCEEFSKGPADAAQVIVVENQDGGEYLFSSDMQLTSSHFDLDRIDVDNCNPVGERNELYRADGTEKNSEMYYGVLVNGSTSHIESINASRTGLGNRGKMHTCCFCHAEFRCKSSLQSHVRKHIRDKTKIISHVHKLNIDKVVY